MCELTIGNINYESPLDSNSVRSYNENILDSLAISVFEFETFSKKDSGTGDSYFRNLLFY